MSDDMALVLGIVGLVVVLFIVFRVVVLWYWKINRMVDLLTLTTTRLGDIYNILWEMREQRMQASVGARDGGTANE